MKQEIINFFLGLIIGFFICLICVAAIKVHLIEPKEAEIINAMTAKQAYYDELYKSEKYAKYFVEGPLWMFILNPKRKWDPNRLEVE